MWFSPCPQAFKYSDIVLFICMKNCTKCFIIMNFRVIPITMKLLYSTSCHVIVILDNIFIFMFVKLYLSCIITFLVSGMMFTFIFHTFNIITWSNHNYSTTNNVKHIITDFSLLSLLYRYKTVTAAIAS